MKMRHKDPEFSYHKCIGFDIGYSHIFKGDYLRKPLTWYDRLWLLTAMFNFEMYFRRKSNEKNDPFAVERAKRHIDAISPVVADILADICGSASSLSVIAGFSSCPRLP